MKVVDNPWELMEDVAKKYPQLDGVNVYFVDDKTLEYYAVTAFNENKVPKIFLRSTLQLGSIPEILAHEMAHIIVGKAKDSVDDHSNEWVDAFAKLLKDMNEWMKFHEITRRIE